MHNAPQPVWTNLIYVLAPGERPLEALDKSVRHAALDSDVRSIASVVMVESGEHIVRVDLVDEVDLCITESSTVDRKSDHSDVPQSDCVEGSFDQNDASSSYRAVVIEKPPNVDALGITVLGTVSSINRPTYNAQDGPICSP